MAKQTEVRVIQLPPGEIEPLFIAARDVPKVIVGLSAKTLANWRSQKIGPNFHCVQRSVYYSWAELKEFFSVGLVKTSGNLTQHREAS